MTDIGGDLFDSRDAEKRILALEEMRADPLFDWASSPDERDELAALEELRDAVDGDAWTFGITFVADSYFEQHARDEAENIGTIASDGAWPATYIDWPRAADALKGDYLSVEYDGVTYWYRA